ncbi:hypothetical protein KIN20_007413 [Parelaphostrongylus tenuis]|uniref:Uncharacterized protein n=1 Tax=Parelaphostrongylus tenuis TaxID=148309 RepID=A0AAD5QM09_PARTN|nr:hypothetical protein KIN20_007413 [Parelaphostrongylus tenuis]
MCEAVPTDTRHTVGHGVHNAGDHTGNVVSDTTHSADAHRARVGDEVVIDSERSPRHTAGEVADTVGEYVGEVASDTRDAVGKKVKAAGEAMEEKK